MTNHDVLRKINLARDAVEELIGIGFVVKTISLTTQKPIITVKSTGHCKQLHAGVKGRGFDGGRTYFTCAAPFCGCQVEWQVFGTQFPNMQINTRRNRSCVLSH